MAMNDGTIKPIKVIYFYKDMKSEYKYHDPLRYCFSHNETINAIEKGVKEIHTFALTALYFMWIVEKGYTIILNENGKSAVLNIGDICLFDKEACGESNILDIWLSGGFNNYFYKD